MTHSTNGVSRRAVVGGLGAGLVGLATAAPATARTATSASGEPGTATRWTGAHSHNGWPIGGATNEYRVEGSAATVTLAAGAPATLLLHAARRIGYELDMLRAGEVVGVVSDRAVLSPQRSNLLSGTAIRVRPDFLPYGSTGNLFPQEVVVLEDVVAESGGALAWGGHLDVPDESLVYLAVGPRSRVVRELAATFAAADRMDSAGGVGTIDAHDPDRRAAAKRHRARVS